MYPEHPTPPTGPTPTQAPVNYLNHISAQPPKQSPFTPSWKLIAIIGAALVVVVIILVIVLSSLSSAQKRPLERLAARLDATETIAADAQAHLKSSQLRSLNSTLRLYLTNVNRDIGEPLATADVNTESLNTSIIAEESTEEMASRLEDARLNAVYDRTYTREIAYQLATTLALLQEINAGNYSNEIKAFATDVYDNLQPTHEAFDEYDAS